MLWSPFFWMFQLGQGPSHQNHFYSCILLNFVNWIIRFLNIRDSWTKSDLRILHPELSDGILLFILDLTPNFDSKICICSKGIRSYLYSCRCQIQFTNWFCFVHACHNVSRQSFLDMAVQYLWLLSGSTYNCEIKKSSLITKSPLVPRKAHQYWEAERLSSTLPINWILLKQMIHSFNYSNNLYKKCVFLGIFGDVSCHPAAFSQQESSLLIVIYTDMPLEK